MVDAFIMIKTGAGRSDAVVDQIRAVDAISEAHVVAGEFDIIAEAEAGEIYDVLQAASADIQKFEGVTETRTYIAFD